MHEALGDAGGQCRGTELLQYVLDDDCFLNGNHNRANGSRSIATSRSSK